MILLFLALLASDPFQSVRFLVGTWNATAAGSGDIGTYSFEPDLRDHVVVRHSSNGGHGDVLYIYSEAPDTPLKAIYFDSEGHVIHYTVESSAPNAVVFQADMYRLTYELKDGVMSGKFQAKPPGQSAWQSYLEWSGKSVSKKIP
jgi:hypothetical protein